MTAIGCLADLFLAGWIWTLAELNPDPDVTRIVHFFGVAIILITLHTLVMNEHNPPSAEEKAKTENGEWVWGGGLVVVTIIIVYFFIVGWPKHF